MDEKVLEKQKKSEIEMEQFLEKKKETENKKKGEALKNKGNYPGRPAVVDFPLAMLQMQPKILCNYSPYLVLLAH